MDYEKIIGIFFGIATAVAKYLRAIGAITQDDIDKFNGIFSKVTNTAGEVKDELSD